MSRYANRTDSGMVFSLGTLMPMQNRLWRRRDRFTSVDVKAVLT
ncbi:uncharacterized protein METZ01_LOCUS513967 [marine metagenome]|uniref:Uncharacterized protein n=1 Tax=marine metagenome TaxID=408172 RepID=A0A383EXF5_9ZZZZ